MNIIFYNNIIIIKFILIFEFLIIIYVNIDKIRLAIYTYGLKGGGTERATALMINYLSQVNSFNICSLEIVCFFTKKERRTRIYNSK